jgi:hypothetical protein
MIERYPSTPDSARGFAVRRRDHRQRRAAEATRSGRDREDRHPRLPQGRLTDIFLNDWDRHPGQWKWADSNSSATPTWVPIPRDAQTSRSSPTGDRQEAIGMVSPNVMTFRSSYPPLRGLTWNAIELDRRLLGGVERRSGIRWPRI